MRDMTATKTYQDLLTTTPTNPTCAAAMRDQSKTARTWAPCAAWASCLPVWGCMRVYVCGCNGVYGVGVWVYVWVYKGHGGLLETG